MMKKVMSMNVNRILVALLISYLWFIVYLGYVNTIEKEEVIESPGYIVPDESFEQKQPQHIKDYAILLEKRWKEN